MRRMRVPPVLSAHERRPSDTHAAREAGRSGSAGLLVPRRWKPRPHPRTHSPSVLVGRALLLLVFVAMVPARGCVGCEPPLRHGARTACAARKLRASLEDRPWRRSCTRFVRWSRVCAYGGRSPHLPPLLDATMAVSPPELRDDDNRSPSVPGLPSHQRESACGCVCARARVGGRSCRGERSFCESMPESMVTARLEDMSISACRCWSRADLRVAGTSAQGHAVARARTARARRGSSCR
jgi:hypothetical protein